MAKPKNTLDDFTVLACNLLTDEIICELPTQNLRFGSRLLNIQPFSFMVPLGDSRAKNLPIVDATNPCQVGIFIDYRGNLVFGGMVWTRDYSASSGMLTINGNEFGSFYQGQYIPATLEFSQVDELDILRGILAAVHSVAGADIGLVVDGATTSGVLRDRTYYEFDEKPAYDAMFELANVLGGFDFRFDVRYGADGQPQKTLVLGYPRLGVVGGGFTRLWDFPGNLVDYDWPEDGTDFVTEMLANGQGEGDQKLIGRAENTTLITNGFPHLISSYAYTDISVQSTLDDHAQQDLADHEHLFKSGSFVTQASLDPVFGTYSIGDEGRFRLKSDRHPAGSNGAPGFDGILRLFGWQVDGTSAQVTLEAGEVMVQ